jgi:energy-coupling factor transport system substrate-specific component
MQEKKSLWKFGTKQVVYAAIGAALYAVLAYATNMIQLPGAGNVSFRPASLSRCSLASRLARLWVSLPVLSAISWRTCSPVTASGSGGISATACSVWFQASFIPHPGLQSRQIHPTGRTICGAWLRVGMGVAALSEMWVSGADMNTVIFANFLPAFIPDVVNGLVLVPLLMIAYAAVTQRSGRS